MGTVPVDESLVSECRALAGAIADDVQRYIARHTTVGVERTAVRALGVSGADEQGAPLANLVVDRVHRAGFLAKGVTTFVAEALAAGAKDVQEAAERIAFGPDLAAPRREAHDLRSIVDPAVEGALSQIDSVRRDREAIRGKYPLSSVPLRYVIVATGNIYDDALQAKAAAFAGADIVAVIRATAQSLLDYVPDGPTTEGYGGTFATQENFRIIRRALDEAAAEHGRYVCQTNYSSGLCMAEIAWMAAVEGLDMLLNDAMYGILFRDINMRRTFVDQYVSRRIIARAGIVINTGEDNYLTTADAVEKAHTVLSSQFINEAFGRRAGLRDEQLGLGHAYEIDPSIEDSFLLEVAQAQLVRQVFPRAPIKWMPPTKHKTGDVFFAHVHDAMFSIAGSLTGQSIQLLGMFSEAVHNPLLMDRYASLKATKYVHTATKNLGAEIAWKEEGIVARRARQVLGEARDLLQEVARQSIWDAIGSGAFADVKRTREGGKGYAGVVAKGVDYINPFVERLEDAPS